MRVGVIYWAACLGRATSGRRRGRRKSALDDRRVLSLRRAEEGANNSSRSLKDPTLARDATSGCVPAAHLRVAQHSQRAAQLVTINFLMIPLGGGAFGSQIETGARETGN